MVRIQLLRRVLHLAQFAIPDSNGTSVSPFFKLSSIWIVLSDKQNFGDEMVVTVRGERSVRVNAALKLFWIWFVDDERRILEK